MRNAELRIAVTQLRELYAQAESDAAKRMEVYKAVGALLK